MAIRTSGVFDVLPDALVRRVLSRLDAPSLARVGCTCRRLASISSADELWVAHLASHRLSSWAVRSGSGARSDYASLAASWRRIEEEYGRRTRRARELDARSSEVERALEAVGLNRACELLASAALFIWTMFVAARLDGNVEWAWATVCIPLYVVAGYSGWVVFLSLYVKALVAEDVRAQVVDKMVRRRGLAPRGIGYILGALTRGWLVPSASLVFAVIPAGLFAGLLVSNLISGWLHWSYVLVPLLAPPVLLFGYPLSMRPRLCGDRKRRAENRLIDYILCLFAPLSGMLVIAQVVLAMLRLWGSIRCSWHAVMAPIYAWDALMAALSLVWNASESRMQMRMGSGGPHFVLGSGRGFVVGATCFVMAITLLIVAVPLTFQLLLGEKLEGHKDYSWKEVFVPLFAAQIAGAVLMELLL
eukprot:m51a1_g4991 hypothetical protein (418) ;mRNA; r:101787-103209